MSGSCRCRAPLPPIAGRITYIDPTETARDGNQTVRVFAEVANPLGAYRAGLKATLQLRPGTAPPVPDAAGDFLMDEGADLLGDLLPPATRVGTEPADQPVPPRCAAGPRTMTA